MPFLAIFMGWLSLLIAMPFAVKLQAAVDDADPSAGQQVARIEAFARGAWHRARGVGPGMIDRASMDLPAGFADDPAWPLQAWSDGAYVYVWSGQSRSALPNAGAILLDADPSAAQVGFSAGDVIYWRDGSRSPRPIPVAQIGLVIRMNIA